MLPADHRAVLSSALTRMAGPYKPAIAEIRARKVERQLTVSDAALRMSSPGYLSPEGLFAAPELHFQSKSKVHSSHQDPNSKDKLYKKCQPVFL